MKTFKIIFNLIQLTGLAIFMYYNFAIAVLFSVLGDTSPLAIFIKTYLWILLLLELIIVINSFIAVFTKKELTIRIVSLINFIIYFTICIIGKFQFDIIFMLVILSLGVGNMLNCSLYKQKKNTV